jgi:hypothetical protein
MDVDSILTGRRGVSLPFTDYCEPIVDEDIFFKDLFAQIVDFGKIRRWKYIEIRGGSSVFARDSLRLQPPTSNLAHSSPTSDVVPLFPTPNVASVHSYFGPRRLSPVPAFTTYLGHTIDLSQGEAKIFSSLRDSTRRNIGKAMAQGVAVNICNDSETIEEFFRLNCLTRKQHGLPPQPFHFFQKIYDHILSEGLGFVTLACHNGLNIAGAVFFHFGGTAIYKYSASDKEFQDLRANNLVMWEGIRWFCHNGYKNLCLGRTELENEGLQQFKSGWGPKVHKIHYLKYDLRKNSFVSSKRTRKRGTRKPFFHQLFQRLPVPALNAIGSLLYRHIG